MKKILISVLIILLLILSYFALSKGIGFLKIKSINDIKNASNMLGNSFNEANELSSKTYPTEIETLENAIKQLKISKQEYNNKNLYNADGNYLGAIEIKTYKIHYLWTILGNYRKDRGIQSLTLDLKSTEIQDAYDLEFTLIGEYTNITDFLYDIENDEELNFEIERLRIEQYAIKTTTTIKTETNGEKTETENPFNSTTVITSSSAVGGTASETTNGADSGETASKTETIYDPKWVQAKFTVPNVGITLD